MKLYLVRHCATDEGPQDDPDRTLNDTGEMQAHAIRKFLKMANVEPDVIISSDFARAEDTAKILQRGDTPIKTTPFLRPDGDGSATSKAVANAWKSITKLAGDAKSVLIVSHGPLIQPLLASVAFNFTDETWEWEHGAVAYVNTHESRFRWFVTPKLAAHLTGAEEPKDVEEPTPITTSERETLARDALWLSESLKRAYKAAALDPLKKSLRASVARRFRKQKVRVLRVLGRHAKNWDTANYGEVRQAVQHAIKFNDPKFGREYAAATLKAHTTGAAHVAEQLDAVMTYGTAATEAAKKIPAPAPPTRTADDLEGELDDTTDREMGTKLEKAFDPVKPLAIGAVLEMVRQQFDQYSNGVNGQKARADTVAEYEISHAYHGGGSVVAGSVPGTVEKFWDIGPQGCPQCQENAEDGWIPEDASFASGDTEPPLHPNCDCSLSYRTADEES